LRAAVIYSVIEAVAGSERVALVTTDLLASIGFKVELITFSKPDLKAVREFLRGSEGVNVTSLIPLRIPGLGIYQRVLTYTLSPRVGADLVVSVHGDLLPYRSSSRIPTIHYCHYPLAVVPRHRDLLGKYSSWPWRLYYEIYRAVSAPLAARAAEEGIVVANSRFVKALLKLSLGIDGHVIYPPVDLRDLLKIPLERDREDTILMLGRYSQEKRYEKALEIMKNLPSWVRLRIAGILTRSGLSYYRKLKKLVERYGLEGRVELLRNIPREKILELMARSSVFLHMYRGEHFGIAVVEAMAAGLIPVAWDFGGPSEYLPQENLFKSLEEIPEKILRALRASKSERQRIREKSLEFSEENFRRRMKTLINSLI